ncbi:MAG: hypothetical protein RL681_513 [Candidatus Parcubacteria bacterium]
MKRLSLRSGFVLGTLVIGVALALPLIASAQSIWPTGYWGPVLTTCHGSACTFCDMLVAFRNLAYVMLSIGIFGVAPIFFIWGGIRIITAGASPAGISAGRSILIGTVVGILIGLAAFVIVNTVVDVLNSVNSGAGTKIWNNGQIDCTPGQIPGL